MRCLKCGRNGMEAWQESRAEKNKGCGTVVRYIWHCPSCGAAFTPATMPAEYRREACLLMMKETACKEYELLLQELGGKTMAQAFLAELCAGQADGLLLPRWQRRLKIYLDAKYYGL